MPCDCSTGSRGTACRCPVSGLRRAARGPGRSSRAGVSDGRLVAGGLARRRARAPGQGAAGAGVPRPLGHRAGRRPAGRGRLPARPGRRRRRCPRSRRPTRRRRPRRAGVRRRRPRRFRLASLGGGDGRSASPGPDRSATCGTPREQRRTTAREVAALAAARLGRHAEALDDLAAAHRAAPRRRRGPRSRCCAPRPRPPDRPPRWRATRPTAADLAERLGVDPDAALQRLHAELLAADDPVRTGVRYDADRAAGPRAGPRPAALGPLRVAGWSRCSGRAASARPASPRCWRRESMLPRVHVVELVGVGAGDDVVVAVGAPSASGAR